MCFQLQPMFQNNSYDIVSAIKSISVMADATCFKTYLDTIFLGPDVQTDEKTGFHLY
jgi:hypothetical protein